MKQLFSALGIIGGRRLPGGTGPARQAGPTRVLKYALPLLVVGVMGCGSDPFRDAGNRVRIVATTGMITDLVRQIGGDRVFVVGLMGPGIDPHGYKAKPSDEAALNQAKLIFYNGLHLEGKMADILDGMSKRTRAVAVTSKLDPKQDLRPGPTGFEGTHDPHIWFDVRLWMKAAECVRDTLIDVDPAGAETYRTNADRYLKELAQLDTEVKELASKVPPKQRVLITAHDAFFYFGRAYGFEVKGLQGVSTESKANTRGVQELAALILERQIPALFVEDSVPDEPLLAVKLNVEAQGGKVVIGGKLYSDALGDPGGAAGTYVGMVRHNINTIVQGLTTSHAKR